MVTIQLTDSMKLKARTSQDEIMKHLPDSDNYTGLHDKDRFYKGSLGELAFEQMLISYNKNFDYKPRFDGLPDKGDFILRSHSAQTIKVDVKTNGSIRHSHLVVTLKQLARYHYDIYVGIRLNQDIAEIWGFCLRQHLKPVDFTLVPSKGCDLKKLIPVERLLERII